MSKTYRKNSWASTFKNEESYAKDRCQGRLVTHRTIKVRKTREEYDRDIKAAEARYHAKIKENGGEYYRAWDWWTKEYVIRKIQLDYVSHYYYKRIPYPIEEQMKDRKEEFRRFFRDGVWNETTRNQGFKHDAKKATRRANKEFCHKVMKELDYDDEAYPNGHEGDKFVWSWW